MAEAARNPACNNYRFIYDNAEDGALMDIVKFFGKKVADRMEPPRTVNGKPVYSETIEDFYYHLDDACKEGEPFIYVLDSMDALSSEDESKKFDQIKKHARKDKQKQQEDEEKGKQPKGSYGDGKAKKNSQYLRRFRAFLTDSGSILVIISQTRDNIGAGFWEPDKTRSGGHALKFYAAVEIWTSVRKEISKKINDKNRQLGIIATCHLKKNRITGKHRRVDVNFYHSHGIDDTGTMVDWLIEEGHWKETKGVIVADEFQFKGRTEKFIKKIESENQEEKLKQLVKKVWDDIETACTIERKPRYV
jgi:hypothetical protein